MEERQMDSNKEEIKVKLLKAIEQMVLSKPEIQIPSALEKHLLKKYGWSIADDNRPRDNIDEFVKSFHKWIIDTYSKKNLSSEKRCEKWEGNFSNFQEVLRNNLQTYSEYLNVMLMIFNSCEKMIAAKEKISKTTKDKCELLDSNIVMLNQRLLFLKYQFFLKLYGENNAINAHRKLQEKLKQNLEILKKDYSDAVRLHEQYNEMKENKNFVELYKKYKELKKIEKRTEIIKQM